MAFSFLQKINLPKHINQYYAIYRYIRGTRRAGEPKLIKGSIKNATPVGMDEYNTPENYHDFIQNVKSSGRLDDVELEEALNSDEEFGDAVSARVRLDAEDRLHDLDHKKFIKKQIIKRKYFKMDIESTLLTHAAKCQIRYLHQIDPIQWNFETLSKSFPVTVSGVKKLLKSNYILRSAQKIKQHDAEVSERWSHLQSKTPSPLITPYTQHMWDEGKILKEHYNGNPNLPGEPHVSEQTVVQTEMKKVGEFSSIIQKYVEYKNKSPESIENTDDESVVLRSKKHPTRPDDMLKSNRYHVDDETDDRDHFVNSFKQRRRKFKDDGELPHSQFKQNLQREVSFKKSNSASSYSNWMQRQNEEVVTNVAPKPVDSEAIFEKIPKFNRDAFELRKEVIKRPNVYYYDDKLGYQHPVGKVHQSKIRLPNKLQKKGAVYKIGKAIYDEDGEFLYKVPR